MLDGRQSALGKEMAKFKTRDAKDGLVNRKWECFPKGSRLIWKMREGRSSLEMVPKQWVTPMDFHSRSSLMVGMQKQEKWLGAVFHSVLSATVSAGYIF